MIKFRSIYFHWIKFIPQIKNQPPIGLCQKSISNMGNLVIVRRVITNIGAI